MLKTRSVVLFLVTLLGSITLWAAEPSINSYNSLISVNSNGSLLVQEQIDITTDGQTIKHGIYRDFPTRYQTPNGELRIQFKVLSTLLNNVTTPHFEHDLSNGVRIYLGDKEHNLPAGTYIFSITYTVLGELGYFNDHDELYWNVTGNGWNYPILKATAMIKLPDGAFKNITGYTAYTGAQGSRDQNYLANLDPRDQIVMFQTNKDLEPKQGLTVVVGWKKGFVKEVSFFQQETNQLLLLFTLGLFFIFIYYFWAWTKFGMDDQSRAVIPEYTPPEGFSPAALRYVLRMRYDKKVLAAAVLNLAVKGYLKIEEGKSRIYTLKRVSDFSGTLSSEESIVARDLFASGQIVELKQQSSLNDMENNFISKLKENYQGKYFVTNVGYVAIGIALTFALLGLMALVNNKLGVNLFLLIFFLASYLFLTQMNFDTLGAKFKNTLCMLFYYGFLIVPLYSFNQSIFGSLVWIYCCLFCILVALNLLFIYLLKRPTEIGQQLINHLKGFKLFLNATEKDRLNFRNPPERTPALFEKYLPFALALGVEQHWAEQFASVFDNVNYQPSWYTGPTAFSSVGLVSSMSNSFSSAISTATTAPGSSSGFGSSGSSGGGGGGGGGGGW